MSYDPTLMIYWDCAEKQFIPCGTAAEEESSVFSPGDPQAESAKE